MSITKKLMLLTHKIQIPIFNQTVNIFIGNPYEFQDYLKDVERLEDVTFNENTVDGICIHDRLTSWIWLREDATIDVLFHELCHAVFDLMADIGLQMSDSEAFCYIMQYLVKECQDIFAIQMAPIKKV